MGWALTFGLLPAAAQDVDGRLVELTTRLAAAPTDGALWHQRAQLRLEHGDRVGALADVSEAIRLGPFAAEPRATRARLLLASGRTAEALADATDGLARGRRGDLLLLRAQARRALGDLERALADVERAVTLTPSAAARVERAWIRALRGEWPQVLEDAAEAAKLAPKDAEPVLLMGIAHRELLSGGVLAPFLFVWTDREPDFVARYALEVGVRGEGAVAARHEVVARGTISAQSPDRDTANEGLEQARAALHEDAIQALVSQFAADLGAHATLRAQLSDAPGDELEPLLVTEESDAPRARWRTRKLISWKNESLAARVAEAKASELRALVSRLETCMLDLSHEAEVEKDAAQTFTAAGADADAQGKREMSLAYRERVEVLRPILTAVKEELDSRGR